MLGVIATLTIQDGKQEGFEALMRDLAAQVKAKEPDCTFYELNKTDDATVYIMMPTVKHHTFRSWADVWVNSWPLLRVFRFYRVLTKTP